MTQAEMVGAKEDGGTRGDTSIRGFAESASHCGISPAVISRAVAWCTECGAVATLATYRDNDPWYVPKRGIRKTSQERSVCRCGRKRSKDKLMCRDCWYQLEPKNRAQWGAAKTSAKKRIAALACLRDQAARLGSERNRS